MGCSRSPYVQSWFPLPRRSIWWWWRLWNHEEKKKEKEETFPSKDSLQIIFSGTTGWSKFKSAFTDQQKGSQMDRKRKHKGHSTRTQSFTTKAQVMPDDMTKCTFSNSSLRILFEIHWFFARLVWKSGRIQTTSINSNHSRNNPYSQLWTVHWRISCSKWSLQKRISSNEMLLSQALPFGDALQENEHALLQVKWI